MHTTRIYKSDEFYTDEFKTALDASNAATVKWLNARTKEEQAKAVSLMRETQAELTRLAGVALKLYIEDRAGDYSRLMDDALFMIDQMNADDAGIIAETAFFLYKDALYELITEEQGGKRANDPELWAAAKEKIAARQRVDDKKLYTGVYSEIRGVYLREQYEAARFAFESQNIDGANYPKRSLDEYIAFTSKISELAEDKIDDIIKDNGGLYEMIFNYAADYLKPAAETEGKGTPAATKKSYLTPVNIPDIFHTPNSIVANEFPFWQARFYKENDGQITFLPDVGNLEFNLSGNDKNPVNIYVALNYEGDITEDGTTTISYNKARIAGFDLAVLDAICSFMEHGTDNIYVSAIDNLLKGGKTPNNKVSAKRQERIILALRKLSGTRIYLDVRNDLNTKYGDMFAEGIYDGAMLEYDGLKATTYAGRETYVFHVKDLPAIYKYSKAKGNIVQFPTVLLDTGDKSDENIIPLKKELLKHITLINKRLYSNHNISITNLYKRADVPEPTGANRRQKSRDKERFRNWLDYWKKYDYIKDYSIQGDTIHITPKYLTDRKSME